VTPIVSEISRTEDTFDTKDWNVILKHILGKLIVVVYIGLSVIISTTYINSSIVYNIWKERV